MQEQQSVLKSIDWITITLYLALLAFGWVSVCGASYSMEQPDIVSLSTRSGMQLVWIGTSLLLGTGLLLIDGKIYETFAYALYAITLVVLFLTIFNPHEIKGSRSWIVMGPLRIQPAEFAKFTTALAVAKLMSGYHYTLRNWNDLIKAIAIIVTPMLFIVMQRETGSALVFAAFFLMLYREGMTGSFLFTGIAMVIYFVVGIRFNETFVWDTPTVLGPFVILLMIQCFTAILLLVY
ncbi:MAG: rod shape-determining protein RodA, partial [Prevotella sp.]|nr:rod shape-determining protein RodA [Prevotella sp.]